MALSVSLIILAATLITAFISGIFGMAGGMILMAVLLSVTSIAQAMIIHGVIQMVSNGWRAYLLRSHVHWPVIKRYSIGAIAAVGALSLIALTPDKRTIYFILGCLCFLVWIPKHWFHLDITRPKEGYVAGFIVCGLNTIVGVVGPLFELFLVQTKLSRQEMVATKSATQMIAHTVKVFFWTGPALMALNNQSFTPILWVLIAAIPCSMMGTWLGGLVLHRMSDVNFKRWMKWIVTTIGIVFILRALGVM